MIKKVLILLFLLFLLNGSLLAAVFNKKNGTLKIVYITDLNLYPTPFTAKKEKHLLEKKYGLLVYESQAIFLDLIRHINKNEDPDVVVFGGNNISGFSEKYGDIEQDVWQLFLDMVSELKAVVLPLFGKNELRTLNNNELVRTINRFGVETEDIWWSYKLNNTLLIGLSSELFFTTSKKAENQISWFKKKLNENKDCMIIIFIHASLIDSNGNVFNNQNIKTFIDTLRASSQVVLIVSGNSYLNRVKKLDNIYYVLSSSLVAYPCNYKVFRINSNKLTMKTVQIPLKGIIKKAEKYLEESDFADTIFPDSQKRVRKHVLGEIFDNSLDLSFMNLKHR